MDLLTLQGFILNIALFGIKVFLLFKNDSKLQKRKRQSPKK